jgi:hypothetical protein
MWLLFDPGFAHFIRASTHSILPCWSAAALSLILAR